MSIYQQCLHLQPSGEHPLKPNDTDLPLSGTKTLASVGGSDLIGKVKQDQHLEYDVDAKKAESVLEDLLDSYSQFQPALASSVTSVHSITPQSTLSTIMVDLAPDNLCYGASPLTVKLWVDKFNDYLTVNNIPCERHNIELRNRIDAE